MKYFWLIIILLGPLVSVAQKLAKQILPVRLPAELLDAENQFSGMFIENQKLYLLAESRIQQGHEARLFSMPLADIEQHLNNEQFDLIALKIPILGLQSLQRQMALQQHEFEGLEAVTTMNGFLYFSVETPTKNDYCYVLKGQMLRDSVFLDTTQLIPILKPRRPDGSPIYNAGFESLVATKNKLVAFYEYNNFTKGNYAYTISREPKKATMDSVSLQALPFRLTDVAHWKGKRYVGTNFFYKGDDDKDYRPGADQPVADALVKKDGKYQSYSRLISLKMNGRKITWRVLNELPPDYWGYNWEAVAAWRGGFFMLNDKYTPTKIAESKLVFIKP